jgi:hypothetical protein
MTNRLDSLPCDVLDLVYDFVGRKNLAPIKMMETILGNENYGTELHQELNEKFNMRYLKAEFEDGKYHKWFDEDAEEDVMIRNETIKKVINARFELNITPLWEKQISVDCCRGGVYCLHFGDRCIRFTMCEEEFHRYIQDDVGIADVLNVISNYDTAMLEECSFNKDFNGHFLSGIVDRVDNDEELLQLMFDENVVYGLIFKHHDILSEVMRWDVNEIERIDDGTILIMDEEEL